MNELIERVPELHLTPQDINKLLPELEAYHAIYNPLFQRREQREQAQKYLHGLLLADVPNKSIETMLLALVGDDPNAIRAMQQFVGQGVGQSHTQPNRTLRRYCSLQPAFLRLALMPHLAVFSCLSKFKAMWRSTAKFCGP